MFSAIKRWSPRCGSQRSRSSASSICLTRHPGGTRRAAIVLLAKNAIGVEAVADLEPLDAVDEGAFVPSGSL